jgi:hypothetical protein
VKGQLSLVQAEKYHQYRIDPGLLWASGALCEHPFPEDQAVVGIIRLQKQHSTKTLILQGFSAFVGSFGSLKSNSLSGCKPTEFVLRRNRQPSHG